MERPPNDVNDHRIPERAAPTVEANGRDGEAMSGFGRQRGLTNDCFGSIRSIQRCLLHVRLFSHSDRRADVELYQQQSSRLIHIPVRQNSVGGNLTTTQGTERLSLSLPLCFAFETPLKEIQTCQ